MRQKEESSLEITEATIFKALDPFLWILKKTGPMVNLEATGQTTLAITGSGEEEGPTPMKRASSQKGKEKGVRMLSSTFEVSPNPNAKGNPFPPCKTRSQLEVSLPEGVTRKRRIVLPSLAESKRAKVKFFLKCFLDLEIFICAST